MLCFDADITTVQINGFLACDISKFYNTNQIVGYIIYNIYYHINIIIFVEPQVIAHDIIPGFVILSYTLSSG